MFELATGVALPSTVAVDWRDVYFTTRGNGSVRSVPRAGGNVTILASNLDLSIATALAVDVTTVYFGGGSAVMACDLPDCAGGPRELAGGRPGYVRGLAIDATHVYFVLANGPDGFISRVPKVGGAVEDLAVPAGDPEAAMGVAVDDTHVYWTEGQGADSWFHRRTKDGSLPAEPFAAGPSFPRRLLLDEWGLLAGGDDGQLFRIPLPTGDPVVTQGFGSYLAGVGSGTTHTYFGCGALCRVPPLGGAVETFELPGGGEVHGLAVDGEAVFLADVGGSRILSMDFSR